MASDLCEGAFQPNFAKKTTENYQRSNARHSFRISVKVVKLLGQILRFMYFSERLFIFGWASKILGRGR